MPVIAITLHGCAAGTTATNVYAYISDFGGNRLLKCLVNVNNGQLANCQYVNQPNSLNQPTGVAVNNGYLYVNNSAFNTSNPVSSTAKCIINGGISTLSDCIYYTIGIVNPIGFTISTINGNTYAYIANYDSSTSSHAKPGSVTKCRVNSSDGVLNNCSTMSASSISLQNNPTPEVVTINTNASNGPVAYITDQQNAGYSFCNVNEIDGSFRSCSFNTLANSGVDSITPIGPRQMTIIGNYAYFALSGNTGGQTTQYASGYTRCSVNGVDGSLSGCSSQQTAPGQLNSPTGIAYNNGYVYITNENGVPDTSIGYSYTMCNVNEAGLLANCSNQVPQGIAQVNYGDAGVYLTYITFNNQ